MGYYIQQMRQNADSNIYNEKKNNKCQGINNTVCQKTAYVVNKPVYPQQLINFLVIIFNQRVFYGLRQRNLFDQCPLLCRQNRSAFLAAPFIQAHCLKHGFFHPLMNSRIFF